MTLSTCRQIALRVLFHVAVDFHRCLRCGILDHAFARADCASCGT
jgi:hypothetical protein